MLSPRDSTSNIGRGTVEHGFLAESPRSQPKRRGQGDDHDDRRPSSPLYRGSAEHPRETVSTPFSEADKGRPIGSGLAPASIASHAAATHVGHSTPQTRSRQR